MPPSGPMNVQDARVIDPVQTQVARGYKHEERAWPHLFPVVTVGARGGKYIIFNPDDFNKVDVVRAPGASRARAEHTYSSENYALEQRALDGILPRETREEAAAGPGVDMAAFEVMKTMASIDLQIELAAAELATTAANYSATHHLALTGNKRWDNDASTPNKAVAAGRHKIRQGIGKKPNVLILGPEVFDALCNHSDVLNQVRYTVGIGENGKEPTVDEVGLAAYFKVDKVVVGYSMSGEAGDFTDVWGKNAILAYSNLTPLAHYGSPSFGYTYRKDGYPMVEQTWWDARISSWVFPVTTEDTPLIVGKDAGFLWTTVIG